MELGIIVLSEIKQSQGNKYPLLSHTKDRSVGRGTRQPKHLRDVSEYAIVRHFSL